MSIHSISGKDDGLGVNLRTGDKVDGRWEVTRKLGEGAFGAVYEAVDAQQRVAHPVALKVESRELREQVLKMEVAVLKALESVNTKHACTLYHCGRNRRLNFMVMSLLGASLDVLRKDTPQNKFTLSTSTRVIFQCLKAVRDMHRCNWLHRDIKPSNFALGSSSSNKKLIYIFDFGLARNYWTKENKLRAPRRKVGFRGTLRYCSVNGHMKKELGRHDDLISLLYMLVEMVKSQLPWRRLYDDQDVYNKKLDSVTVLYQRLPSKLAVLHAYLHGLVYEDKPRYSLFEETLLEIIYRMNYHLEPFDWEVRNQSPQPSQRSTTANT